MNQTILVLFIFSEPYPTELYKKQKITFMPSTKTTYKVVSHIEGTSDTYQYDEIFESKEQAEKIAQLLEERDEYNFSRIPRKWSVEENITPTPESNYFIAYSVLIEPSIRHWEDGRHSIQHFSRSHRAELVKDFIPNDVAEKADFDGHSAWTVKVYDATVHDARIRASNIRRHIDYGDDPTEHLNKR
jgi:hypothetical protein